MSITTLKTAEPPAKADILALLDEVRAQAEIGEVIAVVVIPIQPGDAWETRSAGAVKMLCLGMTKEGWPRHPSRLGYATPLVPFVLPKAG